MPRKELPIPPSSLAPLASELRRLRHAKNLTIRQVAAVAEVSATTVSQAAGGRILPSWDVVTKYVTACGGAPEELRELWEAAKSRTQNAAADAKATNRATSQSMDLPLDPADSFNRDLRELFQASGAKFRDVMAKSQIPVTMVARALNADGPAARGLLPRREVMLAIVDVCGGDGEEWDRRWLAAREAMAKKATVRRSAARPARARRADPAVLAVIAKISSFDELCRRLNIRREKLGFTTYSQLSTAAAALGLRLPKASAFNVLTGSHLFRRETLAVLLTAIGVSEQEAGKWLEAYDRVRKAMPVPRRVRDLTQAEAGVRGPLDIPYIRREVDDVLRKDIRAAAGEGGGTVVLRGGAGAGKNRTIYEALRDTLPDWRLYRPRGRAELARIAEMPRSRSVIMLDPLDAFTGADGGLQPALSRLLDRRVGAIIIGILPHGSDHALVDLRAQLGTFARAHILRIPDELTGDEWHQIAGQAVTDVQMMAVQACGAYPFAVVAADPDRFVRLTTGAALARRWEQMEPSRAATLVRVAVDARLRGIRIPLTARQLNLLLRFYPGSDPGLREREWLDDALAELASNPPGGPHLLTRFEGTSQTQFLTGYGPNADLLLYLNVTGYRPEPPAAAWRTYRQLLKALHHLDADDGPAEGQITFLLSDVCGSARLWKASPDAMSTAIGRRDQICAEVVEQYGGLFPRRQGGDDDGVLVVFARPVAAVACAAEMQRRLTAERWPKLAELSVRIAVHTGSATLRRDGTFRGFGLSAAARLRQLALGGQVLLSQATVDAVSGRLPDDLQVVHDAGVHRRRRRDRAVRVHRLTGPGLRGDLPGPWSPSDVAALPAAEIDTSGVWQLLRALSPETGTAVPTDRTEPTGPAAPDQLEQPTDQPAGRHRRTTALVWLRAQFRPKGDGTQQRP